jgi:hypothetical protein
MGIFGKADKSITFASFLVGFAFMIGKLQDVQTYICAHTRYSMLHYTHIAIPTMNHNEVSLDTYIEMCHVHVTSLIECAMLTSDLTACRIHYIYQDLLVLT